MTPTNNYAHPSSPPLDSSSFEETLNWAYDSLCSTTQKLVDLGNKYLTFDFLSEKARNATKAKVLPLSNPAGWKERMNAARANYARQNALRQAVEPKIAEAEAALFSLQSRTNTVRPNQVAAHQRALEKASEQLAMHKERHANLSEALRKSQEAIDYYETQRAAQIGGRFAGYAGMAANAVVPGVGLVASLAVTGATTLAQVDNVNSTLSEDNPKLEEERSRVKLGILCTVACTTASIAFSYWIKPMIFG